MTVRFGFDTGTFIIGTPRVSASAASAARHSVEFLIVQEFVVEFIFLFACADIFFLRHVNHSQKFFLLLVHRKSKLVTDIITRKFYRR